MSLPLYVVQLRGWGGLTDAERELMERVYKSTLESHLGGAEGVVAAYGEWLMFAETWDEQGDHRLKTSDWSKGKRAAQLAALDGRELPAGAYFHIETPADWSLFVMSDSYYDAEGVRAQALMGGWRLAVVKAEWPQSDAPF